MISRGRFFGRGRPAPARLTVASTLLFLLALGAAAPAQAATGSISGTVIDAEDKTPIEGVEVCAWAKSEGEGFGCAETDAAGAYAIDELEAGDYGVEFWPGPLSYEFQVYDGKSKWSEADPVTVGLGATTGIDAELVPVGSIEGTLRATDGLPVDEVEICAYEAITEAFGGCGYTNADGTYSIGHLEAGSYKVVFWPEGGRNLALQFYDHRNYWFMADVVSVTEGDATTGIDADLLPGATITGRVTSAESGLPVEETRVCAIEAVGAEAWLCAWTNSKGNYAIRYLPPGFYKVVFEHYRHPTEFWNNQSTLSAANPIELTTGALAQGVDAALGSPSQFFESPQALVPPLAPRPPRPKCRRGYKRKLVRGKRRCVKVHRKQRKRHRARRRAGR